MFERGRWTDDSFGKAPDPTRRWHLTRKSADGLYFALRHFAWLDRHAPGSVKSTWEAGAIGCAEAFVHLWKRYRQLGQFIDLETGDMLVGGSTSTGIAPATLALASRFLIAPNGWKSPARSPRIFILNTYHAAFPAAAPARP